MSFQREDRGGGGLLNPAKESLLIVDQSKSDRNNALSPQPSPARKRQITFGRFKRQQTSQSTRMSRALNLKCQAEHQKIVQKRNAEKEMMKKKRAEESKKVYERIYGEQTVRQGSNRNFFKNEYLKREPVSTDFLEEVVDYANLRALKEVVSSTHYDQNLEYGAVLVEISDQKLRDIYGGSFSLEVWCHGTMYYQRQLRRRPRAWSSSRTNGSIIFVLDQDDELSKDNVIHILSMHQVVQLKELDAMDKGNLNEMIKEIRVKDWTDLLSDPENFRHLQFGLDKNNILYMSTLSEIHAVQLDNYQVEPSVFGINGSSSHIADVNIGANARKGALKLDKLFRCLWMYDTEQSVAHEDGFSCCAIFDNRGVADFNRLQALPDPDSPKKLDLQLCQLVELNTKNRGLDLSGSVESAMVAFKAVKVDQIQVIKNVMLYGRNQVTVALRESGQVDLYWNCKRLHSTEELDEDFQYTEIEVNYEQLILHRTSADMPNHIVVLKLEQQQRTSFADLYMIKEYDTDKKYFFLNKKYKNFMNPYQEVFLYDNKLLVAHGNILSYYGMVRDEWLQHEKFEDNIDPFQGQDESFAYTTKKKVLKMFSYEDDNSDFNIGILFQDGTLQGVTKQNQGKAFKSKKIPDQIPGQIISYEADREHQRCLYVIAKEGDQAKLWGFSHGHLKELDSNKVTVTSRIVPLFAPADNTQFVIMETESNFFRIYEHRTIILESGKKSFDCVYQKRIICHDSLIGCMPHSVIMTKGEELTILFDKKNMHVYDMRTAKLQLKQRGYVCEKVEVHQDLNILGLHLLEDRHLYVMYSDRQMGGVVFSQLGPEARAIVGSLQDKSGIGYMDINQLLSNPEQPPLLIPIMSALCGVNSEIMYSEQNKKLIFLRGFNRACIIPKLHHNMLPFEEMRPKHNYIFAQQFKDKFVVLESNEDKSFEWNICSGKHKFNNQEKRKRSIKFRISQFVSSCGNAQNSQFEIYRSVGETQQNQHSIYDQGILPYTLLCYKRVVRDMTDKIFYKDRIQRNMHQVSHLQRQKKNFQIFVALGLDDMGELKVKLSFTYPRMTDHQQHIFLSDDLSRLLDIQEEEATIYKLNNTGVESEATAVYEGHVRRLPFGAYDSDVYQLFHLFTPDFSKHIDIDPANKQWIIRDSLSGEVHFSIPKTFLTYNPRRNDSIMEQTRFIAWQSRKHLSLIDVTAKPHIHEIIEIPDEPESVNDTKHLSYEVCSGTEPYLDIKPYQKSYGKDNENREIGICNYFKGVMKMDIADVHSRLLRKHRILKQIWYIRPDSPITDTDGKVMLNQSISSLVEQKDDSRFERLYEELIKVDFISDPDRYFIEMPFTFLMWRQMEILYCLCQAQSLSSTTTALAMTFDKDVAQNLTLNILPDCQTILHFITRSYQFLEHFISKTEHQGKEPFQIPFIENLQGSSPLHNAARDPKMGDQRTTEYMLTDLLPDMPFDSHGRAIADLIPYLIGEELKFVGPYLDKRLITTDQLRKVCRQDNKTIKEKLGETSTEKQYVTVCDLWPDERLIEDRVLEDSKIGNELSIMFFDMPKLHQPWQQAAKDLASALSNVKDTSIFQYKSIRSISSFRWPITRKYIWQRQLMPYLIYFALFFCYAVFVLPRDSSFTYDDSFTVDETTGTMSFDEEATTGSEEVKNSLAFVIFDKMFLVLLCLLSLYFLYAEWRQVKSQKWNYLTSIWNYADFVPPFGIFIIFIIDIAAYDSHNKLWVNAFRYSMQGVVCFGMSVKIFYFLRIFRRTGFFVNMLIRVVYQVRIFALLYFLIICAFAFSFYAQSPLSIDRYPWFYLNQTYMIGLGGDGMDDWWDDSNEFASPAVMQFLYYLGTIIITIIMLNVLIALVSEAYNQVIKTQQEANDFERLQLINDVAEFIENTENESLCKPNEYLVRATIVECVDSNQNDQTGKDINAND